MILNLWLERIISAGTYLLILTPLLVWSGFIFPHTVTKAYVILLVSEVIFSCLVILVARGARNFQRLVLLDKLFLTFVGILALTSMAGIDPLQSFWGALDRMTGWLLWIHLGLLYIVLRQTVRSQKAWHNLLQLSIYVALVVSFVHLLSLGGVIIFSLNSGGSTFGNSSFFANYLLFHLFFAVMNSATSPTRSRQWMNRLFGIFFLLTIWTTDALAIQIATIGGIGLLISLLLLSQKHRFKQLSGIILVTLLAMSFLFSIFSVSQQESDLRQTLITRSSGARFVIWDIAWQGIKDRPLLGWGLENFQTVFLNHYNPCLGTSACGREMWYDKTHNKLLDVWIESGIFGLISYLAIFFTTILIVWRSRIKTKRHPLEGSAVMALLAAYFVQNITVFDTPMSLFFWVFLLCLAASMSHESLLDHEGSKRRAPWKFAAVCVTLILPISLWFFVVQPARGNLALIRLRHDTTVQQRLNDYRMATSVSPLGRDMRRIFAAYETKLELWKVPKNQFSSITNVANAELSLGIDALQKNLARPTNQLRSLIMLGILYQTAGYFLDPAANAEAEQTFKEAIKLYPLQPQAKWALASLYVSQERSAEAKSLVQEVIDLGTNSPMAQTYKLMVLKWIDEGEFEREAPLILHQFPQLSPIIDAIRAVDLNIQTQRQAFLTQFH